MSLRLHAWCAAVGVAIAIAAGTATLSAAGRRPVTPDDLFKLEEIGDVAFAPDGRSVAFVRRRPLTAARVFQQPFLGGNDRADIWLATLDGAAPVNLTNGAADGAGFWMPAWSPDGTKIAMLSTKREASDGKEDDNVRLWVWDGATRRLTRMSARGADTTASPAFAWVDAQRIAAVLLPEGERPVSMTVEQRAGKVASKAWPKTWDGTDATVSALDSGKPVDLAKRPQAQVALIDAKSGTAQTIASAVDLRDIRVAPDGRHVAFLQEVKLEQPSPDALLLHGGMNRFMSLDRYQLALADAGGRLVSAAQTPVGAVVPSSFTWSPDGRAFALIGTAATGGDGESFRLFRGTVGGAIERVTLSEEVDPKSLVWVDGQRLLLSASHDVTVDGKTKPRVDWWLFGASGEPRNLTAGAKADQVPGDLLPSADGRACFGVAGGDLWRLDVASAAWTNLTQAFEPKIATIAWPTTTPGAARATASGAIVVSSTNGASTDYYRVDVAAAPSGSASAAAAPAPLARPSELATLAAYRPESNAALFTANETTGTFLTLVQGDARKPIVETNAFVRDLIQGDFRAITYKGLEGEELKGWIVLPANYDAGKRYPMVTWVYAGSLAKEAPSILARLNFDHALNLQLLAARGYAVLLPSMPLAPEGKTGSDPYMELTKGVLPAVDKAIELGIADPKRLGVMGQSYGGYSTYGLITQTNRFKAAIALAGLSDLISLYGVFDARFRYEPTAHENLFQQSIAETGQVRMGNPPWKDVGRYLRNSPLFYVDRVQTPLLIVQGDMDYVSMTQGEQFFTALYRQGKRARFLRYWGEGHVFSSPANIRDLWTQMYAWLDEFLAAPPASAAPTTASNAPAHP